MKYHPQAHQVPFYHSNLFDLFLTTHPESYRLLLPFFSGVQIMALSLPYAIEPNLSDVYRPSPFGTMALLIGTAPVIFFMFCCEVQFTFCYRSVIKFAVKLQILLKYCIPHSIKKAKSHHQKPWFSKNCYKARQVKIRTLKNSPLSQTDSPSLT